MKYNRKKKTRLGENEKERGEGEEERKEKEIKQGDKRWRKESLEACTYYLL